MHKQQNMNMIGHNNVLVYGYFIVKFIKLVYVFIRNFPVWQ